MRNNARERSGTWGGRVRNGDSGGRNQSYYPGYYRAKAGGKAAVKAYVDEFGPPPGKGGRAFHERASGASRSSWSYDPYYSY